MRKTLIVGAMVLLASIGLAGNVEAAGLKACGTEGALGACYNAGEKYCDTSSTLQCSIQNPSCAGALEGNCCGGCSCPASTPRQCGASSCFANISCGTNQTSQCNAGNTALVCVCAAGYVDDAAAGLNCVPQLPVYLSPGTQQIGFISVNGDITSGGDIVLSNGQEIRADLAAQKAQIFFRNGTGNGNNSLEVDMHNAMLVIGLKANWTTAVSLSHGQNVIYGAANWQSMDDVDTAIIANPALEPAALLLLQVETGQGMRDRLRVDKSGNLTLGGGANAAQLRLRNPNTTQNPSDFYTAFETQSQLSNVTYRLPTTIGAVGQVLSVESTGTLNTDDSPFAVLKWDSPAAGGVCASTRQFVGVTTGQQYTGDLNGAAASGRGYANANAKCHAMAGGNSNSPYFGSVVCTDEEIMNSYKCSTANGGTATTDGPLLAVSAISATAWVNGGAPGYDAISNDCDGWNQAAPVNGKSVFGRLWTFASAGGKGNVTTCNSALTFACCR